jgi:hypothetical protein
MTRPKHRYFVDARRSVPFDTLEEAKEFAQQNFPAIILERVDLSDGSFEWREVLRFDWVWDHELGQAKIGFG